MQLIVNDQDPPLGDLEWLSANGIVCTRAGGSILGVSDHDLVSLVMQETAAASAEDEFRREIPLVALVSTYQAFLDSLPRLGYGIPATANRIMCICPDRSGIAAIKSFLEENLAERSQLPELLVVGAAAMELARVIGIHGITVVAITENDWLRFARSVDVLVYPSEESNEDGSMKTITAVAPPFCVFGKEAARLRLAGLRGAETLPSSPKLHSSRAITSKSVVKPEGGSV